MTPRTLRTGVTPALIAVAAVAMLGTALVMASRARAPAPPPQAPRTVVGYVAESAGVDPGSPVWYGGVEVGRVLEARRVGDRTRVVVALFRPEVPLRTGDRLRWHIPATGPAEGRVAVAVGPSTAPLLLATDSLLAAPTLDWPDSARRARLQLPGLTRDIGAGAEWIKKQRPPP